MGIAWIKPGSDLSGSFCFPAVSLLVTSVPCSTRLAYSKPDQRLVAEKPRYLENFSAEHVQKKKSRLQTKFGSGRELTKSNLFSAPSSSEEDIRRLFRLKL